MNFAVPGHTGGVTILHNKTAKDILKTKLASGSL